MISLDVEMTISKRCNGPCDAKSIVGHLFLVKPSGKALIPCPAVEHFSCPSPSNNTNSDFSVHSMLILGASGQIIWY
jgi:hypothetical protein